MKHEVKDVFKNISFTISSNLISLVISILVVIIVPKLIGVEEYGYWQLYLFYSSYVGFLHFGWSDGIYLRYGGELYQRLNKSLFFSQFYMMLITQIVIAIIISVLSIELNKDANKIFILLMVALNLIIVNVMSLLLLTLQATNRIKEYTHTIIISRGLYITLIIMLLLIGIREYRLLIFSDLVGKLLSLVYTIFCCKDIVFRKLSTFAISGKETIKNINIGSKLMFANIASMLIIGVVRFGIERSWEVSTFGKVSLTLSISNLLMIFTSAVGVVIFPILRRTDSKILPHVYMVIRNFLVFVLLCILVLYFPLRYVISFWLPKYAESLKYMAILFPISVYEGKMALLVSTYLNTLRKEKIMLRINLTVLIMSVFATYLTTTILRDLNLSIISILFLIIIRSIVTELYLSRLINISLIKDIFLELGMTLAFVLFSWYANLLVGIISYLVCLAFYILTKRKNYKIDFARIREFLA